MLPAASDVPVVAERLLGVSRDAAYESIAAGTFPVPVLRVGRRIRVPLRPLLDVLGLTESEAAELLGLPGDGNRDGEDPAEGSGTRTDSGGAAVFSLDRNASEAG